MTRHLVAMGGGGFSMSQFGEPTALDAFLIGLTGSEHPRVCFAPTASGDDAGYIHRFLTAYGALGARTSVLTLWTGASEAVDRLAEADLLFVGGGSTVNLVALWQAHGVIDVVRQRSSDGDLVLAGISARPAGTRAASPTRSATCGPGRVGSAWSAAVSARTWTANRAATRSTQPPWPRANSRVAMPPTTAPACTTWTARPPGSSASVRGAASTGYCPTTSPARP